MAKIVSSSRAFGGRENGIHKSNEEDKGQRVLWVSGEMEEPSTGRFYMDDYFKHI